MATIGYIRVSRSDQNAELQRDAMEKAGVDRVFEDIGVSGALTSRPGLDAAISYAREGDLLVSWKLDRIGRSTAKTLTLIDDLASRGIGYRSLTEAIDTSGPYGHVLLALIAAIAQAERSVLIERTVAGLKAARARGRVGGRPRAMSPAMVEVARKMIADGGRPGEVSAALGVGRSTLYRSLTPSS